MNAALAGYLGQTLVIGIVTWALIYVALRAIEHGTVAFLAWKQRRADDARFQAWCAERKQIAMRTTAEEQWRRELIAFLIKHPVAGDDSDMVA